MAESLVFGAIASSALVIGALIGVRFELPKRILAILLSFAAGALVTALTFELFEDAYERGGIWRPVIGLFVAAVTLDGVPENVALGVSLSDGTGGLALLAAIFVSNLPESLVGAASMRERGMSRVKAVLLWTVCAALLVVAVVVGAGPLANTDPQTISLPLAFAAGAVIASLADTLMPEAYENGGPAVAVSTTAGFAPSFALSLA